MNTNANTFASLVTQAIHSGGSTENSTGLGPLGSEPAGRIRA